MYWEVSHLSWNMLVKADLPENILLMNMYSLMNRVFTFHIQNLRIEKYKDKVWVIFVLYTSWDELMKDTTTVVDFSLWCMSFWWNIWLIKQDRCIHVAVMISSILDDFTDCKVERRARTGEQNVFLDCCRVWTCAAMCQWISSPSP